jgi:hypothetical protein
MITKAAVIKNPQFLSTNSSDLHKMNKDNSKSQFFIKSEEWVEWIEKSIADKCFKYYEYGDFKNIEKIGSGGFSNVYRANWKNSNQYLVLKSLFNLDHYTAKEIVHEVIENISVSRF